MVHQSVRELSMPDALKLLKPLQPADKDFCGACRQSATL